jgi:hypothetical protein
MRKLLDKEIGKILTDLVLCLEEDQYKKHIRYLNTYVIQWKQIK